MKRRLAPILGLIVLVVLQPLFARQDAKPAEDLPRVSFEPVKPVTVSAGHPVTLRFRFRVSGGYSIGSQQPSQPEIAAASLGFSPPQDVIVAKVRYPAGLPLSVSFAKAGPINVYSGVVTIQAEIIAQRKAVPGNYTVHGEFRYQPCDIHTVYPPQKIALKFDLKVGAVRGSPRPGHIG